MRTRTRRRLVGSARRERVAAMSAGHGLGASDRIRILDYEYRKPWAL